MNTYTAISLGWGLQSWVLAAMSALGDLPCVDAAIHADTCHERSSTYAFAARWSSWLMDRGVPVVTVTNDCGSKAGTLPVVRLPGGGFECAIPAYSDREGRSGAMRRQCTNRWKIQPVRRWLQLHRESRPVELWLGITVDEWQRAKDADVRYIEHRFPLLDLGMSRADCLSWLRDRGLPVPVKSSCVFCPYLNKAAWQGMKRESGADWAKAVAVDASIRDVRPPGRLFVNARLAALPDAVSIPEDVGYSQVDLFSSVDLDAPCDSGYCFL